MLEEIPATSRGRTYLSGPVETGESSSAAVPGGSPILPRGDLTIIAAAPLKA